MKFKHITFFGKEREFTMKIKTRNIVRLFLQNKVLLISFNSRNITYILLNNGSIFLAMSFK